MGSPSAARSFDAVFGDGVAGLGLPARGYSLILVLYSFNQTYQVCETLGFRQNEVFSNFNLSVRPFFEFTLSGDRSLVVLSAGNSLCTLNTTTGQVNSAPVAGFPVAPTPDGKSLLVLQAGTIGQYQTAPQILVLDARIALPFALSQNYDALVADGQENVLIVITGANGNGIAVVDLSSLSEPDKLPYQKNDTERARASGFNERPPLRALTANQAKGTAVSPSLPRSVIKHVTNESLLWHP
jgi:hypothetical protein